LVRLLPMTELASAAAGQLRGEGRRMRGLHEAVETAAGGAGEWAGSVTAGMRRQVADSFETGPAEPGVPRAEIEKLRSAARSAGPDTLTRQDGQPESELLGAVAGAGAGTMARAGAVGSVTEPTAAENGSGGTGGGSTDRASGPTYSGEGASTAAADQRLPGLPDLYQQENGTWDPIELGPEPFPREPLWDKPWPAAGSGSDPQPKTGADGEHKQ